MITRTLLASTALITALTLTQSSLASCHRFAIWHYPYPQSCTPHHPAPPHTWFVEVKSESPPQPTTMSDQDKKDLEEHNAAMSTHHEELKFLLFMQNQNQSKAPSNVH